MEDRKIILIDYNGVAIGNIVSQKLQTDENLIRHMILNSLRMYKQKFKSYGDMVIASESYNNWRREVYPQYKASRKKGREESSLDWDEIFRVLNMVLEEIKENLPYKVLSIPGCEADDIIAQLALNTEEFGRYEDVMIVSADKDFLQLQKLPNINQYSPTTKKILKEENPRLYLEEHILKGDASDGIPNVLSDDNVFVDGRRQNVLSKKKKETLLNDPQSLGEDVYRNYQRNKKLIDLAEIPDLVKLKIINTFDGQKVEDKKGKILPYLINKKCKLLIENAQEFL